MNLREFWRFHFLKALLVLVIIQLGIFAWLQVRNHRPIAVADEVSVIEGKSVKIQPLRNDTDKDEENVLAIKKVASPLHGKITQNDKSLLYEAELGFVGIDSFIYVINDGKKDSKAAFIKVSVIENLKPVANADYAQVYAGGGILLSPIGNDTDLEGDSIFIHEFTEPLHGKLQKIGNEFIYSPIGNLAQADSFQYAASDGYHASDKVSIVIDIKSKNDVSYPWLSTDVGNTAQIGNVEFENKKIVVKASGSDIWDNRDGFNFTYQYINGDCEIITRVDSIENTNEWAKAGVMVRESLNGESKNAFIGMTAQNGITFQSRSDTGNGSEGFGRNGELKSPYWIKLVRKGNTFTGYTAPDGKTWIELASTEVNMAADAYIGLCVTSHDNSKICTTVYSNYNLKGKAATY